MSGVLYGTLGWLWASRSKAAAAAAVSVAFAAEPLVVPGLWRAEVVLGLAGIALALRVPPPRRAIA